MSTIQHLVDLLAELPGVGPRAARRIVQSLLGRESAFREKLARALIAVGKSVSRCHDCGRFSENSAGGPCAICADGAREDALMVVEKDVDLEGVEASGAYHGRYFVLGGLIPMTRQRKNGNGPRVKELVEHAAKKTPTEIILALSTTPEGDYTANEIVRELKVRHPKIKTTLLGRGLSVGAELEYADRETLRNALKNRA